MDLDARAEALFEQYRRPAILLHRPYPPHSARPGNSHFGGLPALAEGLEWPRTSAGVPLHFLCQVDCGEIGWETPLPDRGILYFFGRDDEEQIWEGRPDDCRVLYAPDGPGPASEAPPPADLPPIGWDYPRRPFPAVEIEGEAPRRLHTRWPAQPLLMDSFPEQGGLPAVVEDSEWHFRRLRRGMERRERLRRFWPWVRHLPPPPGPAADQPVWDRYGELEPKRRARAFEEATGIAVVEDDSCELQPRQGERIFADETFPQHWIFIHFIARVALRRGRPVPPPDGPKAELEARIDAQARAWFDRSCGVAPEMPVGEADRRAFREWVGNIELAPGRPAPGHRAASWAFTAAIPVIREWAGKPGRAALIPPLVYDAMDDYFHAIHLQQGSDRDWYTFQFAQMLGLPPASQQPVAVDDPDICLLNLASDKGLGWSFGDSGEATFWISPEELAALDFSRVRGVIQGY